MVKNVEKELQEWFEKMEASPGIYDGLREIGEDDSIGPQERLQEMFLKRLNGFGIALAVTDTEEFGQVSINESRAGIDFNTDRLRENGMISELPFTSSKGITGKVRLDWQHCTVVFFPDSGEPSTYVVTEFLENWSVFGVGHNFSMGFLCVIVPLEEDSSDARQFLSNMSLNKHFVEGLIFAKREKQKLFNPQTIVTFKDVAEVTGVPASTLSNVRNGKKSLDNLTWTTMAVLSFYARIRMLDQHIVDMLRQQLSGERDARQAELQGERDIKEASGLEGVVIKLHDGTKYRLEPESTVENLFHATVKDYNKDLPSMTLDAATDVAGETYSYLMLPKSAIKWIRTEIWSS